MSARAPSLRRRLVVGLVSVLTVGVVSFAAVTYFSLRAFLEHRTDSDATTLARSAAAAVHDVIGADTALSLSPQRRLALLRRLRAVVPPNDALVLRPTDYAFASRGSFPAGQLAAGNQTLMSALVWLPLSDQEQAAAPVVNSLPGSGSGFVVANLYLPRSDDSLLVAVSTQGNRSTLRRLLAIEVSASVGLVVVLALLALAVVRRGLRPLDSIAATALAIAAGQRGRRIQVPEGHTEIGRVTAALNRMISDNEAALHAKEESEAQLRRFVADASHELRTPLASIRSYAELLASGAARGEEQLALDRIQSQSVRMTRLVEDLLLLARLDTGRPLACKPVDLSRLVADAVADAAALSPDRRVALAAQPGITVPGDADRLAQVLTNLLTNARTHTPPGASVDVAVTVEAGSAEISVRDHGPGIPAEEAERIFDRFYRLDPSRSRASGEGGMGLGLAIVAAIVAAHQGSVWAVTPPGGGARFVVRLPGAYVAAPADLVGSDA